MSSTKPNLHTPLPAEAWHSQSCEAIAQKLSAHLDHGLSTEFARQRLAEVGPNELREAPRPPFWKLVLQQFESFLVMMLIVASVISALLGDYVEAAAIMAIVLLNAIIGVVQESKAEEALAALKKMAAPNADVVRDGLRATIPSRELVPGDIVILEAGNYVPADVRLVKSVNLRIEEAALTGESVPVEKSAQASLEADIPLGDRHNTAFMGTLITYGRGRGIVVATGMHTQMGLIAEMLQTLEAEPTPLQQRLDQLGRQLGYACLAICAVVFAAALFNQTNLGLIVAPDGWAPGLLAPIFDRDHRDLHDCRKPGHRCSAGGTACCGHHHPRPWHARNGQAACPHASLGRSGDPRLGQRDLLRQDRHAHSKPDDGRTPVGG